MGKIVRESVLNGVKLSVTPKKYSFDVKIIIPKGTYLSKEGKNKSWSINFRFTGGKRTVEKTIRIKFEKQKYPRKDVSREFVKIFDLDNGIEGRICIQPAFYLSETLREEFWNRREEEREKAERAKRPSYVGICTKVRNGSKAKAKYTYNNLYKPYQGGGCSPK